jgi:hypothetical protein
MPLSKRSQALTVSDRRAASSMHRSSTPKRHHRCGAEEALDPIIVEVHAQAMADQLRWRGVEDATQDEAACVYRKQYPSLSGNRIG